MSEQFIENIAKKLTDKIGVTGRYKKIFGEMEENTSAEETIAKIFGIIFGKLWEKDGQQFGHVCEVAMGEKIEKEEVIKDGSIIGELLDSIKSNFRKTLMLMGPILSVTCNIENELPYELKLILLADVFNGVAHNLEKLFDDNKGKDFWFGLKNEVLLEMINIFDKNSIYINDESRHENRIAIYFKVKAEGQNKFVAWHSTSELLEEIEGYRDGAYESEQIKSEIVDFVPSEKRNNLRYGTDIDEVLQIANYDIYNPILHQHNDFGKPIEKLFEVELKEKAPTLVYEGGGSYETKEEIQDKVSKLLEEMQNADTQEDLELLIKNSDYANKIHDIKILKLRGRYPIYYAQLHINGKTALIECKKGFECKKREDKCYTKDDIGEIETSTVEEISEMLEAEQLIKAKDIDEYIKKHPEKFAEIIKGMTQEQKMIIMRTIICSSNSKELGEIFQKLFGNKNIGEDGNRNGGFVRE